MMKNKIVATVLCLSVWSGVSLAGYSFDDVSVEYWAGDGANQTMVVVDYGSNGSYAFGYQWGDTPMTSFDALLAIDAASNNFTMVSHWDDGVSGYFIDSMAYSVDSSVFTMTGFDISFMTSIDGIQWSTSWDGASDNYLTNGDWDGWTTGQWAQDTEGSWFFDGSVTTPVPEPATMLLFGLGAMVLRRKG